MELEVSTDNEVLPPGKPGHDLELESYKELADAQLHELRSGIPARDIPQLTAAAFARYFLGHYFRLQFSQMHWESMMRYDALHYADDSATREELASCEEKVLSAVADLGERARERDPFQRVLSRNLFSRIGARFALAAPRGSAKSTLHTLLFPLFDVLYQRERYIVILSSTARQAQGRLSALKRALMTPGIAEAFGTIQRGKPWNRKTITIEIPADSAVRGDCEVKRPVRRGGLGEGALRQRSVRSACLNGSALRASSSPFSSFSPSSSFSTSSSIRIDAYGSGSELRGISHDECRPTKIILDDAESSVGALRPYRREQLLEWFHEVVEHLGSTYTHIEMVGTILHRDSLMCTAMKRPDFGSRVYESVMEWATNQELWSQWVERFTNLEDPQRLATAERFYRDNKDAMDVGVRVLWPEHESYYKLMQMLVTIGRSAFFKEKQNSPLNFEQRVFDSQRWRRFSESGGVVTMEEQNLTQSRKGAETASELSASPCLRVKESPRGICVKDSPRGTGANDSSGLEEADVKRVALKDLHIYGFLDPATAVRAGSRRRDQSAIVTLGKTGDGRCYLLDVWQGREDFASLARRIYALHGVFSYRMFGYEANGFQEVFQRFLIDESKSLRASSKRYWQLPIEPVRNSVPKDMRIRTLEPLANTGWLCFNRALLPEFAAQADEYPGEHDDMLDALASCVELARAHAPIKFYEPETSARRPTVNALGCF